MFSKLSERVKISENHPSRRNATSTIKVTVQRESNQSEGARGNTTAGSDKANRSLQEGGSSPRKRQRSEGTAGSRRSTPQSPAKRGSRRSEPPVQRHRGTDSSPLTNSPARDSPRSTAETPFWTPEPQVRKPVELVPGGDATFISAAEAIADIPGDWSFGEPLQVALQLPNAQEAYPVWHPKSSSDYAPLAEMKTAMEIAAKMFPGKATQSLINDPLGGDCIIRRLSKAIKRDDRDLLHAALDEFNALMTTNRSNLRRQEPLGPEDAHEILTMAYCRTVSPRASQLRAYKSFSNNVYGELLPSLCTKIFNETGLTSDGVFVDLGSGVGNVVLQAALEIGCESFGCEIMPLASELAALQKTEVEARASAWGLPTGRITLLSEDFVNNEQIQSAMRRATVVLVNNYAFDGELNNQLLQMFLDLPEGAKIVSLKSFVPPGHTISEHNVESPMNILKVYHREFGRDSVNWTPAAGDYYIAVVDRSRLAAYI